MWDPDGSPTDDDIARIVTMHYNLHLALQNLPVGVFADVKDVTLMSGVCLPINTSGMSAKQLFADVFVRIVVTAAPWNSLLATETFAVTPMFQRFMERKYAL